MLKLGNLFDKLSDQVDKLSDKVKKFQQSEDTEQTESVKMNGSVATTDTTVTSEVVTSPKSPPSTADTNVRRFAFRKSYSLEHSDDWKRRSLIEDAKFESVANQEFEKHERRKSQIISPTISETEETFQFDLNGDISEEGPTTFNMILSMKDGMSSLSRIVNIIESSHLTLNHIETRKSTTSDNRTSDNTKSDKMTSDNTKSDNMTSDNCYDLFVNFAATKENTLQMLGSLRQCSTRPDVLSLSPCSPNTDVLWFPRHITDLDRCTHLVTKFEPELATEHAGFRDPEYRNRRAEIVEIAFNYRHGDPIPRIDYTPEEIHTWKVVYTKCKSLFPSHVCTPYLEIFYKMEAEGYYAEDFIPQLEDLSRYLQKKSGFRLRPVAGLLSARDFLASLAFRVFQCTQYLRHGSAPLHSPEPDVIHELIGHVPLLSSPEFAEFSQELGLASLGASDEDIVRFATLYWFTVEFGLCRQRNEIRVYGAGLISSFGEMQHALSGGCEKRTFHAETTANTTYDDSDYQPFYFVSESFEDVKQKLRAYARTIKRPFEVRYDPYTESMQVLDNAHSLDQFTKHIGRDVHMLQHALEKLKAVTA